MKDFVDLTQLPPSEIDRMVSDLNRNDTEGLRRFYEHLGLLYGYPLEQLVNVFSDKLMFDKRRLHEAFDEFSFKRAVLFLKKFLDILSVETTPLSVVEELSTEFLEVSGYVHNEIPALWEQLSAISGDMEHEFSEQRGYIDGQISSVSAEIQPCTISSICLNGEELSVGEDKRVNIPAPSIEDLETVSTLLKGYAMGIADSISSNISGYGKLINELSVGKVSNSDFMWKFNVLKCSLNSLSSILNCKINFVLNECSIRIADKVSKSYLKNLVDTIGLSSATPLDQNSLSTDIIKRLNDMTYVLMGICNYPFSSPEYESPDLPEEPTDRIYTANVLDDKGNVSSLSFTNPSFMCNIN